MSLACIARWQGFIHALMAGVAVDNKFQSFLCISINMQLTDCMSKSTLTHTNTWTAPSKWRINCSYHRWVSWWVYSPILEEQILEHWLHGQVPRLLNGCASCTSMLKNNTHTQTHTHTHMGLPGWAGTRRVQESCAIAKMSRDAPWHFWQICTIR